MLDDPRERRSWAVLVHGAFLVAALAWFQWERLYIVEFRTGRHLTAMEFAHQLLPEVSVGVLFESLWLLLARGRSSFAARAFRLFFLPAHALVYVVTILDHHFFLTTGMRGSVQLLFYGLANFMMIRGIVRQTVGPVMIAHAAATVLWMAAATFAASRRPRLAPGRGTALLALAPSLLFAMFAKADASTKMGSSVFVELLQGSPQNRYLEDRFDPALVHEVYDKPGISGVERCPNVILLILESVGARFVPPYAPESDWEGLPTFQDLARRSVLWDESYVVVSHSSKALVTMLTGMYPRLTMPVVEAMPGNLPLATLPSMLGQMGYRSAYIQSANGSFENWEGLVKNLGFDEDWVEETLPDQRFRHTGYFGLDEMAMLEPAFTWMHASDGRPFFLVVHTLCTHHPYESPDCPDPRMRTDDKAWPTGYRRALEHTDAFLGTFLSALEQAGRLEDTVVIIVGDHGEGFGEHERYGHDAVPYEEGTRVPLMMLAGPWTGPPRRIPGLRSQLDILPTILEIAGARHDGTLPGASLLSSPGHDRIVTSCYYSRSCLAMREGDTKYVFHYGRLPMEVFDLARDPLERHDLAPSMAPGDVAAGERRLLATIYSVGAFYDRHPVTGRARSVLAGLWRWRNEGKIRSKG
ncbi:MAG: LTA synthase family protein [Acidobacteriota bacterium]